MFFSRLLGRHTLSRSFCTSAVVMNRLANEKSPYILQHKDNPVHWYPWGEEAFTTARELNRPIFLSVGYSTCHWCHVMEKESFENESVAAIMNEHFVSIKVDREERPDVDKLYMSFVQAVSGSGGWPMSVFLTPSLAPITGGTYFPPEDRYGQMGFKSILKLIDAKWNEDPDHVSAAASNVMEILGKPSRTSSIGDAPTSSVACRSAFLKLRASYDKERGGFGDAPKFPKPVDLSFLLRFATMNPSKAEGKEAMDMVKGTLHAIFHGGIHDHVGKGFHRYSVDGGWHVPHFEKMAYDQGQLLSVFSDFALLTGDTLAKEAARDIVEYVDENLSQKDGGFWSAEDADSYEKKGDAHKREGAFCVWTKNEVEEVLKGEKVDGKSLADIFCAYFTVQDEGNVPPYTDPHDELKERNVLIMHNTHKETADIVGLSEEKLKEAIEKAKSLLRIRRSTRPRPHLDSKMITSWQGLMISGHARAAIALKDPMLAHRAMKAVEFVKKNLVDEDGNLIRAVYTDEEGGIDTGSPIGAFSDDYAFLIQGLLDLYETTLDESLAQWAEELQEKMDEKFWEGNRGYYVSETGVGSGDGVRMIEDQDGAEPCSSSAAMNNVVRLAQLLHDDDLKRQGDRIVAYASPRLEKFSFVLPKMLEGFSRLEEGETQVIIIAETPSECGSLTGVVRSHLIPNLSLVRIKPSKVNSSWLLERNPFLKQYAGAESPTVFICQGRVCGLPVKTAEDLEKRLLEVTKSNVLVKGEMNL